MACTSKCHSCVRWSDVTFCVGLQRSYLRVVNDNAYDSDGRNNVTKTLSALTAWLAYVCACTVPQSVLRVFTRCCVSMRRNHFIACVRRTPGIWRVNRQRADGDFVSTKRKVKVVMTYSCTVFIVCAVAPLFTCPPHAAEITP